MTRPRFVSRSLTLFALGALSVAGCGAGGSDGSGRGGTGVSGSAGSTGVAGSSVSAGSAGTTGSAGTNGQTTGSAGTNGQTTGSAGTTGTGAVAGTLGGGGTSATGRGGQSGSSGPGRAGSGGGSATGIGGSGPAGSSGTGTGGAIGGPMGMSAGCGKAPTITSDMYNNDKPIPIMAASLQRRYILQVPTNYVNTKAYKLVIAYHARDSNDHTMYKEKYYGMLPMSNDSTIFVAPNGMLNGKPCAGTGAGESGCGWPNASDQDMQLADAVVKQVTDSFCIDTNRIFATGWSYGASMSEQTACERPLGGTQAAGWGVRAVAVYAVAYLSNTNNCKATKPVAYYASHGTCDSVLSYDGGSRCNTMMGESGGVGIAKAWATANGCTWKIPTKVNSGAHVCTKLTGCMEGYPLEFCSFNGDHTPYPDSGNQSNSWGPGEAWPFLNQF